MVVVIKVGTSSLMSEDPITGTARMKLSSISRLVETCIQVKSITGMEVVLVSSGAQGCGRIKLGIKEKIGTRTPEQLSMRQAVAAAGQSYLMRVYEDLFDLASLSADNSEENGRLSSKQKVAQLLITRRDFNNIHSFENIRNTINSLLQLSVIPIINENDAVQSRQQFEVEKFGDNDLLASLTAINLEADWLFLLTDVDYLFTANPSSSDPEVRKNAKPIEEVKNHQELEKIFNLNDNDGKGEAAADLGSNSQWGTGGMQTKITAAKMCSYAGIKSALINGSHPERILGFLEKHKSSQSQQQQNNYNSNCRNMSPSLPLNNHLSNTNRNCRNRHASASSERIGDAASLSGSSQGGPSNSGRKPGPGPGPKRNSRINSMNSPKNQQNQNQKQTRADSESGRSAQGSESGTVGLRSNANSSENILKIKTNNYTSTTVKLNSHTSKAEPVNESIPTMDGNNVSQQIETSNTNYINVTTVTPTPTIGTFFTPQPSRSSMKYQRRWILALPSRGKIYVNAGAALALLKKKSLMAAGITRIEGCFEETECVSILVDRDMDHEDPTVGIIGGLGGLSDASDREVEKRMSGDGKSNLNGKNLKSSPTSNSNSSRPIPSLPDKTTEIARALVYFRSDDLDKIKGKKSQEFESILGFVPVEMEVCHRMNIILVQ